MLGAAFYVGMQAAGLALNFWENNQQQKLLDRGREINQLGFETSLETARLQTMQASVNSMRQLRQNLGTQIAMNAAMGRRSDMGSAKLGLNASERAFSHDERVRRMNLLSKEANLRAGLILSGFNTLKSETQLGQSLTKRIFKTLPGPSQWGSIGEGTFNFLEGGDALSSASFGGG